VLLFKGEPIRMTIVRLLTKMLRQLAQVADVQDIIQSVRNKPMAAVWVLLNNRHQLSLHCFCSKRRIGFDVVADATVVQRNNHSAHK
jgi:hypothetical protein